MVEDLMGLGKVATAILDKVAAMTGALYEPTRVRRVGHAQADADAYAIVTRKKAELEAAALERAQAVVPALPGPDGQGEVENLRGRTAQRLFHQELRHQQNVDRIILESVENAPEGEARPLEEDWMDAFLRYAQTISAEGVRELWAKILASQATEGAPTVSKATLDALRLLEPHQARVFEKAVKIYLATGLIMDIDPFGEPDIAFNINDIDVMALVDIGFLRRIGEKDTGVSFSRGSFTFFDIAKIPRKDKINRDFFFKSKSNYFYNDKLSGLFIGEHAIESQVPYRDIRIDRVDLTSRGFELAAILFSGFEGQSTGTEPLSPARHGVFAEDGIKFRILTKWAEDFSKKNAFVVMSEPKKGTMIDGSETKISKITYEPVRFFDQFTKTWLEVEYLPSRNSFDINS